MKAENIKIINVSKSFGEKLVLKDMNAEFPAGQVSIIMGESGCGKTTLLNIILGVEKPDSGLIDGVPRLISAVFQEDRLCEDFSAFTNIRITSSKCTTKNDIYASLAALGLSENAATPVRELSGGMKRRVAIARAMLAESSLVIMDEPFKGLDDANRAFAAKFILNSLRSRTLITVTHTESDAELLGTSNIIRMAKIS